MTEVETLYVVVLTYVASIEEIDAAGPDHVAWLEGGYADGTLLASGPRVPRSGGLILTRGASLENVRAFLSRDPFQARELATAESYTFPPIMASNAIRAAL